MLGNLINLMQVKSQLPSFDITVTFILFRKICITGSDA